MSLKELKLGFKSCTYPEELLGAGNNVSDDNGGTEGVDDVLIVGVEDQTTGNFTCRK